MNNLGDISIIKFKIFKMDVKSYKWFVLILVFLISKANGIRAFILPFHHNLFDVNRNDHKAVFFFDVPLWKVNIPQYLAYLPMIITTSKFTKHWTGGSNRRKGRKLPVLGLKQHANCKLVSKLLLNYCSELSSRMKNMVPNHYSKFKSKCQQL